MIKTVTTTISSGRFISWDRACRMLEAMFKQIGIDAFPNVSMGDGYAHYAFASEDRAIVIQPYQGKETLVRQCHQLLQLREQLLESEPNCHVMAALYFSSDAERLSRLKGIARVSPGNLSSFRRFLTKNKGKSS